MGVLGDESRWRLFSFIRSARRPVTREEAAASVGISRKLAAFHLDKMVDAGLLRARPGGTCSAPKVGRRPKVYETVEEDLSVSIPGRQYELLADLLLETILNESAQETARDVATRTAHERGMALGCADPNAGETAGRAALDLCRSRLEGFGYEPVAHDRAEVRLRNCPFHPLAAKATELVCGMNQAFLAGYLEGLEVPDVSAVLEPSPGECCVRLVTSP